MQLSEWNALESAEAEVWARELVPRLPDGFRFFTLRPGTSPRVRHQALFVREGRRYALVPGARVTLGYDRSKPLVLTPEQAEDWASTRECVGLDDQGVDLARFLDVSMSPLRSVDVAPFLLEVDARELGVREITGAEAERILGGALSTPGGGTMFSNDGHRYRAEWPERGERTLVELLRWSHAEVAADIRAEGLRLPTPDEWEYACGAGARTLFWWGDHHPMDREPSAGDETASAPNLQPHPFGLRIVLTPYFSEICSDPRIARGGDAGHTVAQGYGVFVSWLALATAFQVEGDGPPACFVRRACSIEAPNG